MAWNRYKEVPHLGQQDSGELAWPPPCPQLQSLSPGLTQTTLGGRSHGHYARAAFCLLTLGDVPPPSLCFTLHLRHICSQWLLTGFQSMFIAGVSYLFLKNSTYKAFLCRPISIVKLFGNKYNLDPMKSHSASH